VRTTRPDPTHRPATDLVRRNFAVDAPNQLWVADITFVPTMAGFLFLAVVLDAWSRRIVGWAFSSDLRTRVVLDALDMALAVHKPDGVIHHSDKGSQYTSLAFGDRCRQAGVRPSTGSVGDAYDNAMCESFFATLDASSSTATVSARTPRRAWRSSTSSKASTILPGVTRRWATSRRSNTNGETMT